ncbi:TPA: restriction endonuclease subunit S [Pseudomonas aeruginosa]|uniref:restriction endonuclease subunit S n=1 Tax=Pseudomonas aeruginosa TaxID=287 RepID=UPI001BC94B39|nr:restriction endonuclease subunit S [Pseudomonas aeruginosa]
MSEITQPADWSSRRLKYVATYNDEVLSEDTDEDQEIDYVEISGVSLSRGIEQIERITFGQAPSRARRKVQSGDVLVSTVRTYLRAIAKVDSASPDLISSTGFCVVRPGNEVDSSFIGWVAKSEPFVSEVVARSVGVSYPAINASELVNIRVPLPPLETQRRIARFLDEKTTQIDALIEKKRALLDRLAEKRQALITRAVTKGLNPDAPMKPSGIDWLGDIPAHWEVLPLKRLVEDGEGLQMGPFGGMLTDLPNETTGFKLYGQENTISGDFNLGDRWVEEERFYDLQRYVLRPGDLVITRKGSLGSCRKVPEAVIPGIADSDTIRIRPKKRILIADWAITLLHDAQFVADQIASERRGAILSGLNTTVVGSIKLTVPPVDEQCLIILHVRDLVEPLDEAVALIESTENKLREHRTALITAAVTGQIPELNG